MSAVVRNAPGDDKAPAAGKEGPYLIELAKVYLNHGDVAKAIELLQKAVKEGASGERRMANEGKGKEGAE